MLDFGKLKSEVLDAIYGAGVDEFNCTGYQREGDSDLSLEYYVLEGEDAVVKAVSKEVMLSFWDWLDSLPMSEHSNLKAQKTPMSRAIVRNYITGYLHDLEEEE